MKNAKNKCILALFSILIVVISGCNPFFSKSDIGYESDYCGWKVVKWQYDANLNVNCHWMVLEKGNQRKEVYFMRDVAMKYSVGDIFCESISSLKIKK